MKDENLLMNKENLDYEPDIDIEVHKEQAIRLICKAFQSHETGLPEWIKNSSDEYMRRQYSKDNRVIVVIMADKKGGVSRPSISCLDFSGMTSQIIETSFRYWADPEAAKQGLDVKDVQGGHGNGGKCYMTQMFTDYAHIVTVREGRGNRYGVIGGDVRFGYIPDRKLGRDFTVKDPAFEINKVLVRAKCELKHLPKEAQASLKKSNGFTLVMGVGPKGYSTKIPVKELVEDLLDNAQMIRTLDLCPVFVVYNGKTYNDGKPLTLREIPPIPGAEQDRVIPVPATLYDPLNGEPVSTTSEGKFPEGKLILKTSNVSMRWKRKTRHRINFGAAGEYVGFILVPELNVQSPYQDRIYGEVELDSTTEIKQNDRSHLAESPLKRALLQFCADKVQRYAEEFEAKEKRKYDQKEKEGISKINEALDRWKNKFLQEQSIGLWGEGVGGPGPNPPLPIGIPVRIDLALSHTKMGVGVAVRPIVKFFDAAGRRIHPVDHAVITENPEIVDVDSLRILASKKPGTSVIQVQTSDGQLKSNRIAVEVVQIKDITLYPASISLQLGSRYAVTATCTLADGTAASDVLLIWNENDPSIARVTASGMVIGRGVGQTKVTAADDLNYSQNDIDVTVTTGIGKGAGKQHGKGFPKILVSGEIDPDPDTGEFVNFSSDDPPVYQRPQDADRNIWWINSASPLARHYLSKQDGYGYESEAWRMYHIERYIEVITQIALENDQDLLVAPDIRTFILKWGSVAQVIHSAAASELSNFIATGELPNGSK